MPRTISPLIPLAIAALLVLAGCHRDHDRPDPEFLELQRRMNQLADRLIAESMATTTGEPFVHEDGSEGVRRVRIPDPAVFPTREWLPAGTEPIETPGEVVAVFPLERRPWPLLIDNSGTLVIARPTGIVVFDADGDTRTMELPPPASLQWNSDGSLLLIDSPDDKRLVLWPSMESQIDLMEEGYRGRLFFAPEAEAIWQVTDLIDPDPSSEIRVLVSSIRGRIPGGTQEIDILSAPLALAGFGTLPQVGQAWGHRIRAGLILPRPAPLWLLGDDLRPTEMITDPGQDVDVAPAAARNGTIIFLRGRRVIDTDDGLRLAPNTRAWMAEVPDVQTQTLVTGEPTLAAAISPDGSQLGFLVERNGAMALVRTDPESLLELDFESTQSAMKEFEDQVAGLLLQLRQAWSSTAWRELVEARSVEYNRPLEGAEEVLPLMARALRDALAEEHGIELPDSREAVAFLDAWLLAADGLIEEENATILAVGALYGELLAREPGVQWDYSAILPAFSNDLAETTESEGDLYRIHSPFYAAREAISGRLSLGDAAVDALGDNRRAVGLVENFGPRARASFAISELVRLGVPIEGEVETQTWRGIAERERRNMIANEAAWSAANARGEAGIAFTAAMNMAEEDPASPAILLRFARELMLTGMDDVAIRFYDQAAVLAPDDPEVRLAVATAYFDMYRLEEAERMLERIATQFPAEAEVVADHLEVLQALRDQPPVED